MMNLQLFFYIIIIIVIICGLNNYFNFIYTKIRIYYILTKKENKKKRLIYISINNTKFSLEFFVFFFFNHLNFVW